MLGEIRFRLALRGREPFYFPMRQTCFLILALSFLTACRSAQPASEASNPPSTGPLVTPEASNIGNVALVNDTAKYVIVSFRGGTAPAQGEKFSLYRRGLKVGEIRISGPQDNALTAADLLNGSAKIGDELLKD